MGLARDREVSRQKTTEATFVLVRVYNTNTLIDILVDLLYTYQTANKYDSIPYTFTIDIPSVSRIDAFSLMVNLFNVIAIEPDLDYTVLWWWRTPSNSGVKSLLMGIGLKGLYELSRE